MHKILNLIDYTIELSNINIGLTSKFDSAELRKEKYM